MVAMSIDMGRLRIEELIVHDVPSPEVSTDPAIPMPGLVLSEVECALQDDHKNFFTERIKRSLARHSVVVVFNQELPSPIAEIVRDCLQDNPPDLVDPSSAVARHLYASQTPRNPPGILAVARGNAGNARALAILKIEREEGIRIRNTQIGGKTTFDIQVLHDLMLTPQTKVFKAGVFVQEGDSVETIVGTIADLQSSSIQNRGIANFFLSNFLGCRPRQDPKVSTESFLQANEDFFNANVSDPELRARYVMATVTTLLNQQPVVRPEDFARDHLEQQFRAPYVQWLRDRDVPTAQFDKDTALVANRLSLTRFDFASGIAVIAPRETLDQQLHIEGMDDGTTSVRIRDQLTDVHGGKSARSRTRTGAVRRGATAVRATRGADQATAVATDPGDGHQVQH